MSVEWGVIWVDSQGLWGWRRLVVLGGVLGHLACFSGGRAWEWWKEAVFVGLRCRVSARTRLEEWSYDMG